MPQPSGQVLVDPGHPLAGFFAYANDSGMWDAQAGAMLTKVGSGAVTVEGGANVATSNANTYYTLASSIALSGAFSVGFRCRQTANDRYLDFAIRLAVTAVEVCSIPIDIFIRSKQAVAELRMFPHCLLRWRSG
jgi:hypothetical protein